MVWQKCQARQVHSVIQSSASPVAESGEGVRRLVSKPSQTWAGKPEDLPLCSASYPLLLRVLRRCCFITARAATSFARLPYLPDFWADFLICSYWRCSLELAPRRCRLTAIFSTFPWIRCSRRASRRRDAPTRVYRKPQIGQKILGTAGRICDTSSRP